MAEEVDRAPNTFVMNRADTATRSFPDANPPRVTFASIRRTTEAAPAVAGQRKSKGRF